MKSALLVLLCVFVAGCASSRKPSAMRVLNRADPDLARTVDVREFEDRLQELDAKIEIGATPDERIATVALPAKPGYFPPRILRIVYLVHTPGTVEVTSAEVTALGTRFA